MKQNRMRAALVCSIVSSAAVLALGCGGKAINGAETETNSCGTPGKPCTGMPVASATSKASVPSASDSDFVRDTSSCEDNPLLAGCPMQPPSVSVPPPAPAPPPVSQTMQMQQTQSGDAVLEKFLAENVLVSDCGQCHGPSLTPEAAQAGINYINDIDKLVASGEIVPLNSAASLIIQLMKTGAMPPLTSGLPPVSDADIYTVAQYIDNPRYWPGY